MSVTFRPVHVETGSSDCEGMLVFDADRLIAILICLSDLHEDAAGTWYLEYGPSLSKAPGMFDSIDRAIAWIEKAIAGA